MTALDPTLVSSTPAFEGFRAGQRATAIPVQFFTELLPQIEDAAELRVTLYALYALGRPAAAGATAVRRLSELAAERPLARTLDAASIRAAVEAATARGVLLTVPLADGDALLFVNHEAGRRQRDRVVAGTEAVPGARVVRVSSETPSTAATAYEAEVGTLTPSIGVSLAEFEAKLPDGWVVDAIREASRQNKRSWAYIEAILRRWNEEGRDDEATARHPGRDPYAHLYRRGD